MDGDRSGDAEPDGAGADAARGRPRARLEDGPRLETGAGTS
jgi:hypothetical protein